MAPAYDHAASAMYGHGARLNFPAAGDRTASPSESRGSTSPAASAEKEEAGDRAIEGSAEWADPREGASSCENFDVDEMLRMMDADPGNNGIAAERGGDSGRRSGGGGRTASPSTSSSSSSSFQLENPDGEVPGRLDRSENGVDEIDFSYDFVRPVREEMDYCPAGEPELFDLGFEDGGFF